MGMLDNVRQRIRSVFAREKKGIEQATQMSQGVQPTGFDTFSIYGRYGIEPLVDYLRIEQELISRYMDYNEMQSISINTELNTPYGSITVGELLKKCDADPDFVPLVYSYNKETKKIIAALALKPFKTGEKKEMLKINLDNGKSIRATADHLFMLRSGEYVEAGKLKPKDSMMPCKIADRHDGYWYVIQPDQKTVRGNRKLSPVHRLIVEALIGRELPKEFSVHHKNFHKKDNSPSNLEIMRNADHLAYHGIVLRNNPLHRKILSESITRLWKNVIYKKKVSQKHVRRITESFGDWKARTNYFSAKGLLSDSHRNLISEGRSFKWNTILSKENLEKILAMHSSINEACKFLGCVQAVLDRRITLYGLSKNIVGAKNPDKAFLDEIRQKIESFILTKERITDAICSSHTQEEVLDSLGIDIKTFYSYVKKFCIDLSDLKSRSQKVKSCIMSAVQYAKTKNRISKAVLERALMDCNGIEDTRKHLGILRKTLDKLILEYGINVFVYRPLWEERRRNKISHSMHLLRTKVLNAKVVSVESDGYEDTYDVPVPKYHNFAAEGIFIHNSMPELGAALDVWSDEATQFDVLTGRTMWVESDDLQVKKILQNLIDNNLQMEDEMWSLCRELVMYGNSFSEMLVNQEGIIGLNAIPPETIRRYEKGKGLLVGFAQDPRGTFGVTVEDVEKALNTKEPTPSNMAYFEPWQIAHMRLTTQQRQSPYGSCVTADTKVWSNPAVKDIVDVKAKDRVYLKHCGMLRSTEVIDRVSNGVKQVYRLKTTHREIRATENHEFLVYLGNKNVRWKMMKDIVPGDKISIATKMPGIGRPPTLGIRYQKLTDDTPVRLTKRGIQAIQLFRRPTKYGQKADGVLSLVRGIGLTRAMISDFMRGKGSVSFKHLKEIFSRIGLELFEGAYQIYRGERTTNLRLPDFVTPWFCRLLGFLLGDGWISNNQVYFARGMYPELNDRYDNLLRKLGLKVRFTKNSDGRVHQSYVDSLDLVNLLYELGWKDGAHEKRVPQWMFGLPEDYREEFIAGFMDPDGWETNQDGWKAFHTELCNRDLLRDLKTIIDGLGYKCGNIRSRRRSARVINGRKVKTGKCFCITFYKSKLEQPFDYDVVKSKEPDGVEAVYDIGVTDPEHNFIADGIVVHNSILEPARWIWRRLLLLEDASMIHRLTRLPMRWLFYIDVGKLPPTQALGQLRRMKNEFTKQKFINERGNLDLRTSPLASDENIFLPVVDGKRTTEVELMATPEWQVMDDVNYFRDKMFTAIKIPKAYLSAEEPVRSRALAIEDVRFCRGVMRVQRELKNGMKKICKIHLAALGIDPEKVNFEIFMTVPSWAYELSQIEVKTARAEFADKVSAFLSEKAVLRIVFGYTDEEIAALRQEKAEEQREAGESGLTPPEKGEKKPAKTEGSSIMDLPGVRRSSPANEDKIDKDMHIIKEQLGEILDSNKDVAKRLRQSQDFMRDMKSATMFQPTSGRTKIIKSFGMGENRRRD